MKTSSTVYHSELGGRIEITESSQGCEVGGTLTQEFRPDPDTRHVLARFAEFPAQVAGGKSFDEAATNLLSIFNAYLELFVRENGIEVFKARLEELGFSEGEDKESEPDGDSEWSMPITIPALQLAC